MTLENLIIDMILDHSKCSRYNDGEGNIVEDPDGSRYRSLNQDYHEIDVYLRSRKLVKQSWGRLFETDFLKDFSKELSNKGYLGLPPIGRTHRDADERKFPFNLDGQVAFGVNYWTSHIGEFRGAMCFFVSTRHPKYETIKNDIVEYFMNYNSSLVVGLVTPRPKP